MTVGDADLAPPGPGSHTQFLITGRRPDSPAAVAVVPTDQQVSAVTAREVESAASDVQRARDRSRRCLVAGLGVAGVAAAVAPSSVRLALALAAGALLAFTIAAIAWWWRAERVERLALDPDAYAIPAVAEFGTRICAMRERRRLAAFIHALTRERGHPLDLHIGARAASCALQLEAIAHELASPAVRVDPAIAVACRRLLTRPVESPLYNPNLTEEDLRALLVRIRAGLSLR